MFFDNKLILQVRSNCFITYFENHYHAQLTEEQRKIITEALKKSRESRYSGQLMEGTKKRLARCIDILIQGIKGKWILNPVTQKRQFHKLSFITLTISTQNNLSARQAYDECFVHFLQWLRRTQKATTYVWKCEVQQRGQIHYHITTPTFIHYQKIRDKWNNLQRAAGWLKDFEDQYGHSNPNSTDIHEVRKVTDLSSYLKKEFCKTIQNPQTEGKIWDASYNLKSSKYYQVEYDSVLLNRLIEMKQTNLVQEIELDQCSVIKCNPIHYENFLSLEQLLHYDIWKLSIKEKIK